MADVSGLTFVFRGKPEKVTNPEQALSFAGPDYQGVVLFPFRLGGGYAIMTAFNDGPQLGTLTISPHDEGYPGVPLSPRNQAWQRLAVQAVQVQGAWELTQKTILVTGCSSGIGAALARG